MHPEKLQAFVLSNSDYGESDRIVSLFTLEHGRLKGFARGARNSRKRFGPALEPFARINLQMNYKETLSSLQSADIITLYSGIRGELGAIAHALYACELIDSMTPELHPLPRLFRLFASYMEHLDSCHFDDTNRRMFEINLLNILGYRPSLAACSRCGKNYDSFGAVMQDSGELVCRFCGVTGVKIEIDVLKNLTLFLTTSRFGNIVFENEALNSAGRLLDEVLITHSSRKFKSLEFLQQLSK